MAQTEPAHHAFTPPLNFDGLHRTVISLGGACNSFDRSDKTSTLITRPDAHLVISQASDRERQRAQHFVVARLLILSMR
ncbi:MAG: hypothetical protein OER56_10170, partial [Hyphomicrobiales bacterium]|nr:hypothetical protein [Hyphomicrobiales bacterium]